MPGTEDLDRWRALALRLCHGPPPSGDRYELCRRVIDVFPSSDEGLAAFRILLEGAMADATTDIDDAQDIMRLLKALDRHTFDLVSLLGS